mgnify:CR=1 FL=1
MPILPNVDPNLFLPFEKENYLIDKYPYLKDKIQQSLDAGFSETDIESFISEKIEESKALGFKEEDIARYGTGAGGEGYLEIVGKSAMKGATAVPRFTEAVVGAGLEAAGVSQEDVERPFREASEFWTPETRSRAEELVTGGVESLVGFATTAAVAAPLAGTAGVLGLMGLGTGAEKYEESRREGYERPEALAAGLVTGGLEAGTEIVPL